MLDKKKKDRVIAKFKTHKNDTGSPEVQIAILSAEIKELSEHLKEHKKDFSSRRGLIRKVSQRRKLLHYLQREDAKRYERITDKLKIKKRIDHTLVKGDDIIIEEDNLDQVDGEAEPDVAEDEVKLGES